MCGIFGIKNYDSNRSIENISKHIINSLIHRGPNFQDYLINKDKKIALYHTRLSILDVSSSGNQPMVSKNKNFFIVYNGEVYNFQKIKNILLNLGIQFQSTSDTEVILEAISLWGVRKTITMLEGMFSLCVYDNQKDLLYLARDRVGIKPLYWGKQGRLFAFGSELKTFQKLEGFNLKLNKPIIKSYLKYGYIPSPYSIYEDIFKLEPGNILEYNKKNEINIYNYVSNIKTEKNNIDYNENKIELKKILRQSVKLSMISDVEIGSMLSSGIDSSLITALMQENNMNKINTYTVGFDFLSYDESKFAKKIANFLGTNHNELILNEANVKNDLFNALDAYDEPFADSSQLPTFLISKYIKKNVSVALSGDGGDEIFGGYNRYVWASKFNSFNKKTPLFLRKFLTLTFKYLSNKNIENLQLLLPEKFKINQLSNKLFKISNLFEKTNIESIYDYLISQISDPQQNLSFLKDELVHEKFTNFDNELDYISNMQKIDFATYLPDDILTKVDRASMANSLEVRVPFLNHSVVDFMETMPIEFKIKKNKSKIMLREILSEYIPSNIINRPKKGFAIPLQKWLRSSFKEPILDTLSAQNLKNKGIFNTNNILTKLENFYLKNNNNLHNEIWTLFILTNWLDKNNNA